MDWESDPILKQLWIEYFDSLSHRLQKLNDLIQMASHTSSFDFSEVNIIIHNLAGTAKTYNFVVIAEAASLLEDLLPFVDQKVPRNKLILYLNFMAEILTKTINSRSDPSQMLMDLRMAELRDLQAITSDVASLPDKSKP